METQTKIQTKTFRVWPSTWQRAKRYEVANVEEALKASQLDGCNTPLMIVDNTTNEKFVLEDGVLIKNGRHCDACGMG